MRSKTTLDSEGYYVPRMGQILAERYIVDGVAGKGVFSCVVKARRLPGGDIANGKCTITKFENTNVDQFVAN